MDYIERILEEIDRVVPRGHRPGQWMIVMPIERFRGLVMKFAQGPDYERSGGAEVARVIMQGKRPIRLRGHRIVVSNGVGYHEICVLNTLKGSKDGKEVQAGGAGGQHRHAP